MICPLCRTAANRVLHTSDDGAQIRRRRECVCGHRWTTYECAEVELLRLRRIADLHFHDLRKKAGNDAHEQGQAAHQLLGNDAATARRHYLNVRPIKARPTK